MSPELSLFIQYLAYVGIAIGLVGTVLPFIPGPLIIWLSGFLWAWADGFERVGWPTLLIMALIAILAEVGDLIFAAFGARRGGASWQSLVVAGAAAVAGFLIFSLPGALVGAVLGMLGWETYRQGGEWRQAWKASGGVLIGYILAMVLKFVFAVVMILIFVWQAFYAG